MNTNRLEGMRCPHCGAEAPFDITAMTVATMYDDGCERTAGMEWDDTSACVCKTCGHAARVGAFREPE